MREEHRGTVSTVVKLMLYISAVCTLAAAMLAFAFWRFGGAGLSQWLWTVALGSVVLLAQRFPVHWSAKSKADISSAPLFATVLLLSPPLAMTAGGVATIASALWRRRPGLESAFSTAEVSLEVGVASVLFHALAANGFAAAAASPLGLAAVVGAAATFYLLNTAVVSGAVAVQLKKSFASVWLHAQREVSAVEAMLFSLGFLAALLAVSYPWALLLVAAPVALCYRLLQGVAEKAALSSTLEEQLKQLKAYEAELVQAAKLSSLGTLASGVAHEVNNPLFVIMGRAEMLLQSPGVYFKTDKARQHVQVIHDMSKRIEGIVGSLLGYTRCRDESGPVDLNEATDEVLLLVEHEIKAHKVSVATNWWREASLVWGNRSELQQVFMNLVMNAMDALPEGGTLALGTKAVNGTISLSVEDNGVGMARNVQEHLFEPFFTTKAPGRGTGLGLYLSRKIVERHHGKIAVTSEPGRGSCFEVVLPRLAPDDAKRGEAFDTDSRRLVRSG